VNQYKQSVHGKAVFEESNPDTPACDECHGIHNISQASTVQFRLNSPEMCANCHTNETIMAKYGISTQVMNTYVADFHGTTITLFEKTNQAVETNKPVCYDCHGVHNILAVDDPQKGLQVKENMLVACQRCHPDASENFAASWMSHYIPDPQRTPIVFYVDLFYKLFVPGVLGGMAVLVVADIYGRFRNRGNHEHHSESKTSLKEE
jgi:RecJ-like exonuclease